MFIHDQNPYGMVDFSQQFIWGYCLWDWPNYYKDPKAQDDAFFLYVAG